MRKHTNIKEHVENGELHPKMFKRVTVERVDGEQMVFDLKPGEDSALIILEDKDSIAFLSCAPPAYMAFAIELIARNVAEIEGTNTIDVLASVCSSLAMTEPKLMYDMLKNMMGQVESAAGKDKRRTKVESDGNVVKFPGADDIDDDFLN